MSTCPICNQKLDYSRICLTVTDHSVSGESFQLHKCPNCSIIKTEIEESIDINTYYETTDYVSHQLNPLNLVHLIYRTARYFTTKQKRKLIQKYSTTKEVLDFGCGTGNLLKELQNAGLKVTGIEPNQKARDSANKLIGGHVYKGLSEVIGNFQVITLWHVLEHTKDPNRTIKELLEKLDPNGRLIIALPNYESYDATYYKQYWAGYDVPRHLWHFSKQSLQALAKNNKLHIEEVIPMKLDSFYVSLLSEKYRDGGQVTIGGIIKAVKTGWKSNVAAKGNINYSSLIYILSR